MIGRLAAVSKSAACKMSVRGSSGAGGASRPVTGTAVVHGCLIKSWGTKAPRARPASGHRLKGPGSHDVNLLGPSDCAAPFRHGTKDGLEIDLVIVATLAVKIARVDLPGDQE